MGLLVRNSIEGVRAFPSRMRDGFMAMKMERLDVNRTRRPEAGASL
jgi:hypothetical protein